MKWIKWYNSRCFIKPKRKYTKKRKEYSDVRGYRRFVDNDRLVHREMAYDWIYCFQLDDEYPLRFRDYVVHHIDGNRKNNAVNNLIIPNNNYQSTDLIKTVLYFCWHRCQIEDRAYPQSVGWDGCDMYITLLNESL